MNNDQIIVVDAESDGLLETVSKIHCFSATDLKTNTVESFNDQRVSKRSLYEGVKTFSKAKKIIGHNFIAYDKPLIDMFYKDNKIKHEQLIDTLVMSRLAYADNKSLKATDFALMRKTGQKFQAGSHGLKAWGRRLDLLKGSYGEGEDVWADWNQEMETYCEQDTRVTTKLFRYLSAKKMDKRAIRLEHDVAEIIARQMRNGWQFDTNKAEELAVKLTGEKLQLIHDLQKIYTGWFKQSGKVFTPARDNASSGYVKGAPLSKIVWNTFNPGSGQQIAHVLVKYHGWVPTVFTDKGNISTTADVLEEIELPNIKEIQHYLKVAKLLSQLSTGKKGWLKAVKPDGRIYGSVNSNGAATGRMTHSGPNLAQVPASGSFLGDDCRSLFIVPKGKKLVGCDASGLELRCLAHYLARWDKGAYADITENGDVHEANMVAAGFRKLETFEHIKEKKARKKFIAKERGEAKTFIYTYLYGGGNELIAVRLECTVAQAKKIRGNFDKNLMGLKQLKDAVAKTIKTKGYLTGLDGRRLYSRSEHSALNLLLQSCGAVVMKQALVNLDRSLKKEGMVDGVHFKFVGNIHDEFQIEVDEDKAELVGRLAVEAIRKVTQDFDMKVQLDGGYDVGDSWKDTHE